MSLPCWDIWPSFIKLTWPGPHLVMPTCQLLSSPRGLQPRASAPALPSTGSLLPPLPLLTCVSSLPCPVTSWDFSDTLLLVT